MRREVGHASALDGYPLRSLIDFLEPLPSAKYVRFVTITDRKGMEGQRKQPWYPWPYYEGLRIDEARHDLLLDGQLVELAESKDLESTMSDLEGWARSLRAKVLPDDK